MESLRKKLKGLGYDRVVIARTGTEAVEKARQLQPFAIFLNPLLPLLSGWDVLTLLKSNFSTKNIPTIAIALQGAGLCPIATQSEFENFTPPSSIGKNNGGKSTFDLTLNNYLSRFKHRILEADSLEQADLLTRIWNVDVAILNGSNSSQPLSYLQALSDREYLSSLPLVILDANTTQVANEVNGLKVFPCLIDPDEKNLADLMEVIQIAAQIKN